MVIQNYKDFYSVIYACMRGQTIYYSDTMLHKFLDTHKAQEIMKEHYKEWNDSSETQNAISLHLGETLTQLFMLLDVWNMEED